jgi:hypothetical protein
MTRFRQVDARSASATALGILIPPGPRTVVVLRPRALPWDLVLLRPTADRFWEIDEIEAALMTRRVCRTLEACLTADLGRIELVPGADRIQYTLRVVTHALVWLLCARDPGKPFRPLYLAHIEAARAVAKRVGDALSSHPSAEKDWYTNLEFAGFATDEEPSK